MKNKLAYFGSGIILFILFLIIFPRIFSYQVISGGDYTLLNREYLSYLFHFSFSSWINIYNFGQNTTPFLNYAPFNLLIGIFGKVFQNDGVIVERVAWWIPFFAFSFYSLTYFRKIVPIETLGFLSSAIF